MKTSALQKFFQRWTVNEFHDKPHPLFQFQDINNRDNVGMVEICLHPSFLKKTLLDAGMLGFYDFEGKQAVEKVVSNLVYDSHSTFSQKALYDIFINTIARNISHTNSIVRYNLDVQMRIGATLECDTSVGACWQ